MDGKHLQDQVKDWFDVRILEAAVLESVFGHEEHLVGDVHLNHLLDIECEEVVLFLLLARSTVSDLF